MKIGIIGIGHTTLDFGIRAVSAGYEVLFSSPTGNACYREVINKLGTNAKLTNIQQAAQAKIIILFLPRKDLHTTLMSLPNMKGKIILHTSNPFFYDDFPFAENPQSSFQIITEMLPSVDLTKVFGVQRPYDDKNQHRAEIFISAIDKKANNKVKVFLKTLNFSVIDLIENQKLCLAN